MYNELPSIDISNIEINFDLFRHELVTFYLKCVNPNKNGLSLKHFEGQPDDHLDTTHLSVNTVYSSTLENLRYINKTKSTAVDGILEKMYSKYNDELIEHSPYIIECITKIEQYTGITFGRARLMAIKPLTCIMQHRDFGSVRYHIPIVTVSGALFAVNDGIFTMPSYSKMYAFPCKAMHVALNGSDKLRLHLMLVPTTEINEINIGEQLAIALEEARIELNDADPTDRLLNSDYYVRLSTLYDQLK